MTVCFPQCFIRPFVAMVLGIVLFSSAALSADAQFSVAGKITRYRTDKPIYLALYASAQALRQRQYTQCLRYPVGSFSKDSIRYEFKNVAAGEYVVAVFQDYNGDKKLNIGALGPTEPYRVYQSNYGIFGPEFAKCKFRVDRDIRNADMILGVREVVEPKAECRSSR